MWWSQALEINRVHRYAHPSFENRIFNIWAHILVVVHQSYTPDGVCIDRGRDGSYAQMAKDFGILKRIKIVSQI